MQKGHFGKLGFCPGAKRLDYQIAKEIAIPCYASITTGIVNAFILKRVFYRCGIITANERYLLGFNDKPQTTYIKFLQRTRVACRIQTHYLIATT
jgi:hypothetical protein